MNKQVTIVIPAFNRPELTRQTLESLFQNTNPKLYDLHVVDDGSDAETHKLLIELRRQFSGWTRIRNNEPIGPAASRNMVCSNLLASFKGKYLYHSDNDVYFKPGWLEKLIEAYEALEKTTQIKLLGGGCHPYLQNNTTTKLQNADWQVGIKDAVSGYSQLMTWETWDKYGPFDEGQGSQEIKIMGSEDWALCQRIIKDGFFVASIEPEVVIHCGKTNTYGAPATGSETFKDIEGVLIK